MTAIAKFQFCNFVQIFVAAREIHSYSDPMAGRRKTDSDPTTGRKKSDLDPMICRKKMD